MLLPGKWWWPWTLLLLVMLPEASELSCSCPLKQSCLVAVLWVSHMSGTSGIGVLHWGLESPNASPLVTPL